eukprot:990896-Amphidinium_carterae.1
MRISKALRHFAVCSLGLVASTFFDDAVVVDDLALGDFAQSTLEGLCEVLPVLGWEIRLKPAKRKVMATVVEALGVVIDLAPADDSMAILVSSTERRVEEVSNFVKAVLDK